MSHKNMQQGSTKLAEMDPGSHSPEIVRMIVEIPKNSANKYEYDTELGLIKLDRPLYSPMHYPGDYGFIPGTLAEDDDPIDVLTLVEEPTFPGCLMEVRPLALLDMVDSSKPDQKILAVPFRDPRFEELQDVEDIPAHTRKEIEHFFQIYKDLEGKAVKTQGWLGREHAYHHFDEARRRFLNR